jgi:hypothetical protein
VAKQRLAATNDSPARTKRSRWAARKQGVAKAWQGDLTGLDGAPGHRTTLEHRHLPAFDGEVKGGREPR